MAPHSNTLAWKIPWMEEAWCQLGDTGRHPGGEGYKADRLIRWRKRLRGMPDEEERARQLAMIEQLEG